MKLVILFLAILNSIKLPLKQSSFVLKYLPETFAREDLQEKNTSGKKLICSRKIPALILKL
jgi:hypothetical protein